jgi:hypothetical protein
VEGENMTRAEDRLHRYRRLHLRTPH